MEQIDKRAQRKESIVEAALKLFSSNGFHRTTIPDIAAKLQMSAGNLYNYFSSKDVLAQEVIKYASEVIGAEIREATIQDISTKEKIKKIVEAYFSIAESRPEMIDYFLRVYLSHREVFAGGCNGMMCVSGFIEELRVFFEDGVASGDLHDQDFYSAFGLFMGYLGGMVFLKGEMVLPDALEHYVDDISNNIYNALKA